MTSGLDNNINGDKQYLYLLGSCKLESVTLWGLVEVKISWIVKEVGAGRMGGSCRGDERSMGDRSYRG